MARGLSHPFRILFVIGSLDIGGTEKQLYLLLRHLDRKQVTAHVVCLSNGGYWVDKIAELGVEFTCLTRTRSYETKRLAALMAIMKQWHPHIVHSYQPPGHIYACLGGLLAGTAGTIAGYRSFDKTNPTALSLKGYLNKLVYRRADVVVCNSKTLEQDLRQRYGKRIRTTVIYNGINPPGTLSLDDLAQLRSDLGIPAGVPVVGTVGRLVPIKNHRLFIDVAKQVLQCRPDTRFVLMGGGELEQELRAYAARQGLAERVIFTGQRRNAERLMRLFDVFVLTTFDQQQRGEGLPNAVMEAMLQEVPCVVSRSGGTHELFSIRGAGFLPRNGSAEKFADYVLQLLRDPALREQMGRRGKQIIEHAYGVDRMVRSFMTLYRSVLNQSLERGIRYEAFQS